MQFAFVLLQKNVDLDPVRIRVALERVWSEPIVISAGSGEGEALSFAVGERDALILMPVSAPVPDGEAEAMAGYSISTLGTGWQLGAHEAHLIATLQEEDTGLSAQRLVRFSRLLAGVVDGVDGVVGIYCGEAHATHDPDFFRDMAMEESLLPVHLWNGVSIAGNEERVSLLSLGMKQLGQPNLKLTGPRANGNELIDYFFNLLEYAAKHGAAIPDGETVGRSAEEKLVVRHEPSPIAEGETVWCVDVPG
jgi:Domain of unknown function (DUF4261)